MPRIRSKNYFKEEDEVIDITNDDPSQDGSSIPIAFSSNVVKAEPDSTKPNDQILSVAANSEDNSSDVELVEDIPKQPEKIIEYIDITGSDDETIDTTIESKDTLHLTQDTLVSTENEEKNHEINKPDENDSAIKKSEECVKKSEALKEKDALENETSTKVVESNTNSRKKNIESETIIVGDSETINTNIVVTTPDKSKKQHESNDEDALENPSLDQIKTVKQTNDEASNSDALENQTSTKVIKSNTDSHQKSIKSELIVKQSQNINTNIVLGTSDKTKKQHKRDYDSNDEGALVIARKLRKHDKDHNYSLKQINDKASNSDALENQISSKVVESNSNSRKKIIESETIVEQSKTINTSIVGSTSNKNKKQQKRDYDSNDEGALGTARKLRKHDKDHNYSLKQTNHKAFNSDALENQISSKVVESNSKSREKIIESETIVEKSETINTNIVVNTSDKIKKQHKRDYDSNDEGALEIARKLRKLDKDKTKFVKQTNEKASKSDNSHEAPSSTKKTPFLENIGAKFNIIHANKTLQANKKNQENSIVEKPLLNLVINPINQSPQSSKSNVNAKRNVAGRGRGKIKKPERCNTSTQTSDGRIRPEDTECLSCASKKKSKKSLNAQSNLLKHVLPGFLGNANYVPQVNGSYGLPSLPDIKSNIKQRVMNKVPTAKKKPEEEVNLEPNTMDIDDLDLENNMVYNDDVANSSYTDEVPQSTFIPGCFGNTYRNNFTYGPDDIMTYQAPKPSLIPKGAFQPTRITNKSDISRIGRFQDMYDNPSRPKLMDVEVPEEIRKEQAKAAAIVLDEETRREQEKAIFGSLLSSDEEDNMSNASSADAQFSDDDEDDRASVVSKSELDNENFDLAESGDMMFDDENMDVDTNMENMDTDEKNENQNERAEICKTIETNTTQKVTVHKKIDTLVDGLQNKTPLENDLDILDYEEDLDDEYESPSKIDNNKVESKNASILDIESLDTVEEIKSSLNITKQLASNDVAEDFIFVPETDPPLNATEKIGSSSNINSQSVNQDALEELIPGALNHTSKLNMVKKSRPLPHLFPMNKVPNLLPMQPIQSKEVNSTSNILLKRCIINDKCTTQSDDTSINIPAEQNNLIRQTPSLAPPSSTKKESFPKITITTQDDKKELLKTYSAEELVSFYEYCSKNPIYFKEYFPSLSYEMGCRKMETLLKHSICIGEQPGYPRTHYKYIVRALINCGMEPVLAVKFVIDHHAKKTYLVIDILLDIIFEHNVGEQFMNILWSFARLPDYPFKKTTIESMLNSAIISRDIRWGELIQFILKKSKTQILESLDTYLVDQFAIWFDEIQPISLQIPLGSYIPKNISNTTVSQITPEPPKKVDFASFRKRIIINTNNTTEDKPDNNGDSNPTIE